MIDALDEWNEAERQDVIEMISSLTRLRSIDIHILFTSRTDTPGVRQLVGSDATLVDVAIQPHKVDEDIMVPLTDCFETDNDLKKWYVEFQAVIKKTLTGNAAGMFRWFDCQLREIRQCRKPKEVKQALSSPPQDLYEVYARELADIDRRGAEDVRKALGWLTFPQRP